MKPYLGCKNLKVRFYNRPDHTLNNVSLSVAKGEKVLLLGPSGCGKSTLLSALAGIIPEQIEADISGEVIRHHRAAVMFQDPDTQFCMLHVGEEIAFSLENRCVPQSKMDAIIDKVMAVVGLDICKSTPIDTLSGGMKQRLSLACLMALEPEILFFDEPTAQLDPAGRAEVFQLLEDTSRKTKKTMIFIEHVLDGLIEWMDRVIILNCEGKIIGEGMPEEVLTEFDREMTEAGIWKPKLFPANWSDIANNADHPLAAQLEKEWFSARARQVSMREAKPALFEIKNASMGYRKHTVLSNIDLTINKGEWISIIGHNGSGKSTLLKSLIGLERLQNGRIYFQDRLIKKWRERDLYGQAGFVFQNPELQFVTNTVYDEVAFGGRIRNWDEQIIREKTLLLLREFGLEHHSDVHPFTLSQGQKRRLSVATMLLFDQEVLLLDEPTFGQDKQTASQLLGKLQERQKSGTTIVMISHDMDTVDRYSDRVIMLSNGTIAYQGTPFNLFSNPELLSEQAVIPPLHYQLHEARKEHQDDEQQLLVSRS